MAVHVGGRNPAPLALRDTVVRDHRQPLLRLGRLLSVGKEVVWEEGC
jgi:hypothetical protein